MSYGEELMLEMLIQNALEEQKYGETVNRLWGAVSAKVWITAENQTVKISNMSDRHVRNCISLLKRKLPEYDDWFCDIARNYLALFAAELQRRYPQKDATEGFYDNEEDDFIESLL